MTDLLDKDTLQKIAETLVIGSLTLVLFFALRSRMLVISRVTHLPEFAFRPIRRLIRYLILAVGLVLLLGVWGYQINGIMAVLGTVFGLVAIGFVATWSLLSNFLCTFVLIIFRPFSVGDELEFLGGDTIKGRVVDLSMLFTTLEVAPNEMVLIPNNTFFQRFFRRRIGAETVELKEQLQRDKPHRPSSLPPAA